jgi:2',3'-cyclic-nucleotide 2'-phosphodiesterase (5'-nucleotidase family)
VSKAKLALLSWALLFCTIASGAQTAVAQATPKPTPSATPAASPAATHPNATLNAVDSSLPNDPGVDEMLGAYSPKVRALDTVIGKLKGDLKKGSIGSGSLGNFVTDGMRAQASEKLGTPILLAVTNSGGLRRNTIPEGDISLRDIFELLPFENALVAFDLTGDQVMELMRVVVSHRDVQSGMRVKYRINSEKQFEAEGARFILDGFEKDIDPAATYTVISIDYLLNVTGSDYAAVLKKAANIRPLNLTMRDGITNYVKAETAAGRGIKSTLDCRFVFDKAASGTAEEPAQ